MLIKYQICGDLSIGSLNENATQFSAKNTKDSTKKNDTFDF